MKTLSIAFVSVLSLAAFAGCKKGGDCKDTVSAAMDKDMAKHSKDMKDMPDDMKKKADEMAKKMKDVVTKACTDDKWSADVLKCINDSDDPKKCDDKLSPEQKANLDKAMGDAMGMGKMDKMDKMDKPADGSGSAAPAGSGDGSAAGSGSAAPAAAGGGGDLPQECQDYKAAIDKLASCDKLPQASRDALKQAYDQASSAWSGLPPEAKASLAQGCKAGADAVKQSASICN